MYIGRQKTSWNPRNCPEIRIFARKLSWNPTKSPKIARNREISGKNWCIVVVKFKNKSQKYPPNPRNEAKNWALTSKINPIGGIFLMSVAHQAWKYPDRGYFFHLPPACSPVGASYPWKNSPIGGIFLMAVRRTLLVRRALYVHYARTYNMPLRMYALRAYYVWAYDVRT